MANSITYARNHMAVLDEVYRRAACSTCPSSPRRMACVGRNARKITVLKIEVIDLGDYKRNGGYKAVNHRLQIRGEDVQLRSGHQAARGRDGRRENRRMSA